MIFDTRKSKSYVLGYDLSDNFCQISYLASDSDMPQTLSLLRGSELYNIPTYLSKQEDAPIWYYGKEAYERSKTTGDIVITDLIQKARKAEKINVAGQLYDPVALLSLFIKKSLSLLSLEMSMDLVKCIVFTIEDLDDEMIEILTKVQKALGLKNCNVHFQSHEESLYYYMLYQDEDLWAKDVLAIDYDFDNLTLYKMQINRLTKPMVVTVQKQKTDELSLADKKLPNDEDKKDLIDEQLKFIIKKYIEKDIVSSAFLLGNAFREDWMKKSLKYLCLGRRVFQGNNLFSKGASLAAKETMSEGIRGDKFIFLNEDKIKYNVGMMVKKAGIESYLALIDAGKSWFDASKSVSFILDKGNELLFEIMPVASGRPHKIVVTLNDFPKREEKASRILLQIDMVSADTMRLVITDQGFGDIYPSSGWSYTANVCLSD